MEKDYHRVTQEGKDSLKNINSGRKMSKREEMENDGHLETQESKDR